MGVKISELPAASLPIGGSETIPLVQATVTKRTSVIDITSTILRTSLLTVGEFGDQTTINGAGRQYVGNVTLSTAQNLTAPTKIVCAGSFTSTNTITSNSPIEIECSGNVLIQGAISCPYLSIRAGGTVSIEAAITTHSANGTYHFVMPSYRGSVGMSVNSYWRLIAINAVGNVSVSAALTSDDIFIKSKGSLTVSSTITGRWLSVVGAHAAYGTGWSDGFIDNSAQLDNYGGGGGGTGGGNGHGAAGGWGIGGVWKATNSPYLLPTLALARGAFGSSAGSAAGDGQRGRGGGRINLYCDGAMTLTGATLSVNGGYGDEIGGGGASGGGGGGGTVRGISKVSITNGTVNANGGGDNDGHGGGGGGAYMIAPTHTGTLMTVAGGGGGATSGTALFVAIPGSTIAELEKQLLFEADTYAVQSLPVRL